MIQPFSDEIARVTRLLEESLAAEPLPEKCRAFALGGKRLRSQILFAAAASNPLLSADGTLLRAAAAIELVHAGSLLHDDIVDGCDARRGVPALHREIGVEVATRSGLCLVEVARGLIAELPTLARRRIGAAARHLSRGQFLELVGLGDLTTRADDRIRIMRLKTASVFGLSCELGAMLVGENLTVVKRWRSVGEAFGILFQIADDLDDIFGSTEELGRRAGADLRDGVMSLPILFGLESIHRQTLTALLPVLRSRETSETAVRDCALLLQASGAVDRTVRLAHVYADTACRQLDILPSSHGTEWFDGLTKRTLARCTRWESRRTDATGRLTEASLGR